MTRLGVGSLAYGVLPPVLRTRRSDEIGHIRRVAGAQSDLVIYSTTDEEEVADVIRAFRTDRPDIDVRYLKQNSDDQYGLVVQEAADGHGTADLVWSSAMDLQMKLVNDGYARPYVSTETGALLPWAVFQQRAYAVTAEPIVIAYNRQGIAAQEVPRTHAALRDLLTRKAEAFRGRVATYDPERSGSGMLFLAQDAQITPTTWDLVAAIGRTNPKLFTSTSAMLEGIASGDLLIAYNVIGSYAQQRALRDPAVGVALPADYTLYMSRLAFVPQVARNPAAGESFLDFLLSRRGQSVLAAHSLGSVRGDVNAVLAGANGTDSVDAARPIHVGPALMAYLDQAKRTGFLKKWRATLEAR